MIFPSWNTSSSISAFATTRERPLTNPHAQSSITPHNASFGAFNLALHVGDDENTVQANRCYLQELTQLPAIQWMDQVHGIDCHRVHSVVANVKADALWTTEPDIALAVMTADCLPVLMSDKNGTVIAAVHAGWRGLASGIIEQQIQQICENTEVSVGDIVCWLGPCIQQAAFQVGEDVREAFIAAAPSKQKAATALAFTLDVSEGVETIKYLADLPTLAMLRLQWAGVQTDSISLSQHCTFAEASHFYSYRRDGQTGRQATVIIRRA